VGEDIRSGNGENGPFLSRVPNKKTIGWGWVGDAGDLPRGAGWKESMGGRPGEPSSSSSKHCKEEREYPIGKRRVSGERPKT